MLMGARQLCSAVVLDRALVLTAAHCVTARADYKIIGNDSGRPLMLAPVAAVMPHPQFDAKVGVVSPDLALLKVVKPLPESVAPAFFGVVPVLPGDRLMIVGYGLTVQNDRRSAGKPRMALFTVQDRSPEIIALVDPSRGGISGCNGDSGAPVFATRSGVPTLVGIVSRTSFCGGTTYAVPVSAYRPWLVEAARKLGAPLD